MSFVNLFGSEVQVRDFYCSLDDNPPSKVTSPYVNVYVQLTDRCNAGCDFCCNPCPQGKKDSFNLDRFRKILKEIKKNVSINKLSFTGGEPTLCMPLLSECLHSAKSLDDKIFTIINTNGTRLHELSGLHELLDSIALSRHHYDDDVNRNIFKNPSVADRTEIEKFPCKDILHLSCNLIKGYVKSGEEVVKYLEHAAFMGCDDVGFVTLMKVNDYCKERFVDFKDLDFDSNSDVFISKNWDDEGKCRCRNYLYIAKNASVVRVYSRYYVCKNNCKSVLVYDGTNLRQGFGGKIITGEGVNYRPLK